MHGVRHVEQDVSAGKAGGGDTAGCGRMHGRCPHCVPAQGQYKAVQGSTKAAQGQYKGRGGLKAQHREGWDALQTVQRQGGLA